MMTSLVAALAVVSAPADLEHFEKHVRPVLVEKCLACHGPEKQRGGLRLDSRAALLKGGDSGPALVPGKPADSLLIKAVKRTGDLKMPQKDADALTPNAVAALEAWVKDGAAWPAGVEPVKAPSSIEVARKTHWSFKPITRPAIPIGGLGASRLQLTGKGEAANPIDNFLLPKLHAKGLAFAPEADRGIFLRRVSFSLTGLPPTPDEVTAFLADKRPDAHARLVDRLLASPAHGERWGRHWLDVARYADTKGYVFTEERRYPYSYTYRDYVVRALNADLPYDTFIKQQIAADRMDLGHDKRPLAAMGFLTLGRRFLNNAHDIIDDRIDVVTRGLMGLTVSCARCHDHKFDPIPTRDYYSLHGVFASSIEPADLPLLGDTDSPLRASFEAELAKRQAVADKYVADQRPVLLKRFREKAGEYMLAAETRGAPPQQLNRAMVQKWRDFLRDARAKKHPFYAAWFDARDREAEAKKYTALFAGGKNDGNAPFDLGPDLPPYFDRAQRDRANALKKKVDEWKATGPGAPPRAMALADAASPTNPRVLIRGNPGNPGVAVPRQFPEVLTGPARQPFTKGSGRLELAEAIASKDNPLTARVMANRVWMLHFGKGLVATPGNFGLRGDPPSHPELLDWLASELIDSGWSLKHLHRLILTSRAYRQSSEGRPDGEKADPENTLLWRMNRRRLEFEPLRDAVLAVSGQLDRLMGGPAVEITADPSPPRRTVYAFIERQNLPGVFRTFDLASPDASTPKRHGTTVPQQALFLMNSPFLKRAAKAFAAREDVAALEGAARVSRMHLLAYGRPADKEEAALGLTFVNAAGAGGWEQYAQVLLLANELAFTD